MPAHFGDKKTLTCKTCKIWFHCLYKIVWNQWIVHGDISALFAIEVKIVKVKSISIFYFGNILFYPASCMLFFFICSYDFFLSVSRHSFEQFRTKVSITRHISVLLPVCMYIYSNCCCGTQSNDNKVLRVLARLIKFVRVKSEESSTHICTTL